MGSEEQVGEEPSLLSARITYIRMLLTHYRSTSDLRQFRSIDSKDMTTYRHRTTKYQPCSLKMPVPESRNYAATSGQSVIILK